MNLTAKESIDMLQEDSLRPLYYAFPMISLIYYAILGKSPLATRNGSKGITLNSGSNRQVFTGNFSYAGDKLDLETLSLTGISQYLGKSLRWKAENLAIEGGQYEEFMSVGDDAVNIRSYALRGIDVIIGSSKSDVLYGGKSADLITGANGVDKFIYLSVEESKSGAGARDVIKDFKGHLGERIDLSAIDADTVTDGKQAFTYIGSREFTGMPGEVRFLGGVLQVNTGSDITADMEIELQKVRVFESRFLIL